MSGALRFATYDSGLGREQMICAGDGDCRLLILPPLFDEMNKLRRTLVMAMRALAERGYTSVLPDLPGLNESQTPLSQCRLSDWQKAMRQAATECGASHVGGLRSACLLDDGIKHLPRWRYAPVAGERVATQMIRAQLAGDKATGINASRADYELAAPEASLNIGGYHLSAALLNDVRLTTPSALTGDEDVSLDAGLGPALWLRAEPGENAELANALTDSWAKWITQ